ncbi:MAG: hypothetical protein K6B65_03375 [Bacilli bacterium]|nr:hypothetical protein [Bacilli bacterium]
MFCCISAQLIQNLPHNIEMLIYLPLKEHINDLGWFFLSLGVILLYAFPAYLSYSGLILLVVLLLFDVSDVVYRVIRKREKA